MIIIDICITVRVCVCVCLIQTNHHSLLWMSVCAHEHTLAHIVAYVIITYANELNSNMRNI